MASEQAEAYRQYYREVELHWSWRRERQIIVSPLEFEQIEQWYEAEIPLAVVLRGLDLFIEKKKKSARSRNYLINHAHGTVEKVLADYHALHAGVEEQSEDESLLTAKLRKLARKVKALRKEHPDHQAYLTDLAKQLEAIDGEKVVAFEDIERKLVALDEAWVTYFHEQLDAEEMAGIREEVEELLTEDEDPDFYKRLIDDGVRTHFGLVKLTALG
jgi:hypothetical protein